MQHANNATSDQQTDLRTPDGLRQAFLQSTPDPEVCDRFLAVASPDLLPNLDRLGLILIGPETFALGVTRPLLAAIDAAGFLPVDLALQDRLSQEQVATMFFPTWVPQRFRWWMIEQRFSMGHTAALLVTHRSGDAIGDRLREAKGYRIPRLARDGTWRKDLGAINGVLNLVHTADGPVDVLRNTAPFFAPERLAAALERGPAMQSGAMPALQWSALSSYGLMGFDQPTGWCASFLTVYFKVLRRLLAQEWIAAPHPLLEAAQERIAPLLLLPLPPDGPQTHAVIQAIRAVARCEAVCSGITQQLVRLLTHLREAPQVEWDRWLGRFAEAGLRLDPWEKLILITTLYYADVELPGEVLAAAHA